MLPYSRLRRRVSPDSELTGGGKLDLVDKRSEQTLQLGLCPVPTSKFGDSQADLTSQFVRQLVSKRSGVPDVRRHPVVEVGEAQPPVYVVKDLGPDIEIKERLHAP